MNQRQFNHACIASEKLRALIGIDRGTTFQPKWQRKFAEREFVRVVEVHRPDPHFDHVIAGPYFVPKDKWLDTSKEEIRIYELMEDHDVPVQPLTVNMHRRQSTFRHLLVPISASVTEADLERMNGLVSQSTDAVVLRTKIDDLTREIELLEKQRSELVHQRIQVMIDLGRRQIPVLEEPPKEVT